MITNKNLQTTVKQLQDTANESATEVQVIHQQCNGLHVKCQELSQHAANAHSEIQATKTNIGTLATELANKVNTAGVAQGVALGGWGGI